ncbi:hypothetical protein NAP1_07215 [Erythrobacter sp. NAP1]|uniref:hypothetical protein n=1 Tax=Erythrobacter sp. NAP1 TaxID=237727 RepID=UPI0000686BC1|nr:hypothetical protein [Erythrobacter sp. NAP1]EAQ30549.1 hypothetical protein NAP1_07215 [Erythrobacter sp. NAP1]
MLKRASIFLGSAALLAAPASAQLREAALPEIFESYNDCFAATESGSISTSSLEDLGWARATMRDGDGNTVEDGPIIYGHGERAPIIILSDLSGDGICMVNARIESFDTYEEFKAAFGGKLPDANEKGEILFSAQGHIVQIAPTGSREAPAMRLVVGTRTENN